MGKGSSSSTTVYQPAPPAATPAVARAIKRDVQSAQTTQVNERERMRGISSTYQRFNTGDENKKGSTLGG